MSLRRPGGSRIGSGSWAAAIPASCSGFLVRPFELDADPLDGNADAPYYGVMEVYGRLSAAGAATGSDTRGAAPLTPGDQPGRYARGHVVSGGVMVGWHESGDDPVKLAGSEAILGEPFGLVRSYASTWRTPSTKVRDWLAQGKFVLWSVKPPDDLAGHDDWTPVADGTQDAMIRQQVALLQSGTKTSGASSIRRVSRTTARWGGATSSYWTRRSTTNWAERTISPNTGSTTSNPVARLLQLCAEAADL